MNFYRDYESQIQRDIKSGNPDLSVSIEFKMGNIDFDHSPPIHQDPNVTVYRRDSEKKIYIDWRDLGYFLIEEGTQITFQPIRDDNLDISFLKTVLFGPILSIVLFQRDILVLHASAVQDENNKVIAFSGDSGTGKSTMATIMYDNGFYFVTDDILPVKFDKDLNPWVIPTLPLIKIDPHMLTHITGNPEVIIPGSDGRISFTPSSFTEAPTLLHKIYFLTRGRETSLKELDKQDFLMNLVRSTYCHNLFNDQEMAKNLLQCSQLMRNVQGFQLELEFSLDKLQDISSLILD